jgi:hypothetical protein
MRIARHFLGNAVLLALGYYWLGLGEARVSDVVWSAVVALLILAGAAWLYGASLAGPRAALIHLPFTGLVALLAFAAYLAMPAGKWWWIPRYIFGPILFIPAFGGAATHAWRVWRGFTPRALVAPVLVFFAVWIPLRLLNWVPRQPSFALEMTSFVLRAALAYLLFCGAWIVFARIISGGRPPLKKPNTASLP